MLETLRGQEQWGPWAGLAGWKQRTGASSNQETRAQAELEKENIRAENLCGGLCCVRLLPQAGRQDFQVDPLRAQSPEEGHRGGAFGKGLKFST